ncbi:hypothetical protein [Marinobacter sp.]|jgi:hypothetical protein|uniref:hypothetical protein n=1 Tax=Marinobacter sp. TaxID=50741 RepID=UPI0023532E62|nr:hypothetical protein [Marinobacter sp.]|tara:strand:- start:141 stop:407 length:267 start_codon:yes stop_codon:yes gene_type:complete
MSGLFKTPKYTPPVEVKKTDELLDQREAKAEAAEKRELKKTSSALRARRRGGRLLYSQDRAIPQLGVGTTLAGTTSVRNPFEDERRMT